MPINPVYKHISLLFVAYICALVTVISMPIIFLVVVSEGFFIGVLKRRGQYLALLEGSNRSLSVR